QLKKAAPKVEFLPARTTDQAAKLAKDADAVVGFAAPEVVSAGKGVRWIQAGPDDDTREVVKALKGKTITLTAARRVNGPGLAEQTFALLLALTRGKKATELRGKNLLIVGLSGPGEQVARRADAFGMRVRAIDAKRTSKPDAVITLEKMDHLDA